MFPSTKMLFFRRGNPPKSVVFLKKRRKRFGRGQQHCYDSESGDGEGAGEEGGRGGRKDSSGTRVDDASDSDLGEAISCSDSKSEEEGEDNEEVHDGSGGTQYSPMGKVLRYCPANLARHRIWYADTASKGFHTPLKACAYRNKGMVVLRHPCIIVQFCPGVVVFIQELL